jgi:hypothetical protein
MVRTVTGTGLENGVHERHEAGHDQLQREQQRGEEWLVSATVRDTDHM